MPVRKKAEAAAQHRQDLMDTQFSPLVYKLVNSKGENYVLNTNQAPICYFPGGNAAHALPGERGIAANRQLQPDLRRRQLYSLAVRSKSSFKLSRQVHNPLCIGDIPPLSRKMARGKNEFIPVECIFFNA